MCGKDAAACEKAAATSRDSLPQSFHLFFPALPYSGELMCEKKGTMGSKLTTSPIYDRLTVFLRNRTKGPEIQIQDKDLRFKKIFQPLTTDIFDL